MKKYTCTVADCAEIIKAREIINNNLNKPLSLKHADRTLGMRYNKMVGTLQQNAICFKEYH